MLLGVLPRQCRRGEVWSSSTPRLLNKALSGMTMLWLRNHSRATFYGSKGIASKLPNQKAIMEVTDGTTATLYPRLWSSLWADTLHSTVSIITTRARRQDNSTSMWLPLPVLS